MINGWHAQLTSLSLGDADDGVRQGSLGGGVRKEKVVGQPSYARKRRRRLSKSRKFDRSGGGQENGLDKEDLRGRRYAGMGAMETG